MSRANLVAIGVETPKIDSGCSLKKEFTKLAIIGYHLFENEFNELYMSFFDLRHQQYLIDGRLCFDYDLEIHGHEISKTSYARYDMKSSKMIVYSIWDPLSYVFEEIVVGTPQYQEKHPRRQKSIIT